MSKKRFEECPYLWEVKNKKEDVILYAYANTASEALRLTENEIGNNEPIQVKIVCFANDIVNFK